MTKRKSLSLRNRFRVFKRDDFKCKYCGRGVPEVILEVDHILPVSKGGDNSISNLTTSCYDCNRGKSDELLSEVPDSVHTSIEQDLELKTERIKQINYLNKLMKDIREDEEDKLEEIGVYWWDFWVDQDKKGITIFAGKSEQSIKVFLKHLLVSDILDSIDITVCKGFLNQQKAFKYFCGVCWNKIKSNNNDF